MKYRPFVLFINCYYPTQSRQQQQQHTQPIKQLGTSITTKYN
jgi:hypothetical protein